MEESECPEGEKCVPQIHGFREQLGHSEGSTWEKCCTLQEAYGFGNWGDFL